MKIAVCGAAGRMGQAIINIANQNKNIEKVFAFEYAGNTIINQTINGVLIDTIDNFEKELSEIDVSIDFTNPESALKNAQAAAKYKVPVVIGATGFNAEQTEEIEKIANAVPVVLSGNMSQGINVLLKLVAEAAKKLNGYDIEIVEFHHNKKKDAPSGTAKMLLNAAAQACGKDAEKSAVYGRSGIVGQRTTEEIGVLAGRAGDIVGDHTVYIAGPGERLELTHRAHSRDTFASGALRAAKWLIGKPAGLYSMQDVLI